MNADLLQSKIRHEGFIDEFKALKSLLGDATSRFQGDTIVCCGLRMSMNSDWVISSRKSFLCDASSIQGEMIICCVLPTIMAASWMESWGPKTLLGDAFSGMKARRLFSAIHQRVWEFDRCSQMAHDLTCWCFVRFFGSSDCLTFFLHWLMYWLLLPSPVTHFRSNRFRRRPKIATLRQRAGIVT